MEHVEVHSNLETMTLGFAFTEAVGIVWHGMCQPTLGGYMCLKQTDSHRLVVNTYLNHL